jgi:predicted metalloendopeptidase
MDISGIEAAKLSALDGFLTEVDAVNNHSQLASLAGYLTTSGLSVFIDFSVHPDLGDSKKYAAYIEPASLGLPEREYYLDPSEKAEGIREKYHHYLTTLLHNEAKLPLTEATEKANTFLMLERELALHMIPKEEKRQIEKLYNPHSTEELSQLMPKWNWDEYFQSLNTNKPSQVIVTEPAFIGFLGSFICNVDIDTIKQYIKCILIHQSAPHAHTALEETHFDLYARTLEGIESMKPRKERIVRIVNHSLGEALGQLFVSKHFPPAAKTTALEMVADIVSAFENRIRHLEWMSEATKNYAIEKLASLCVKTGYPDTWKDYSALDIQQGDGTGNYLRNIISAAKWKFQKDMERVDKPVDKDEWFMAPQVVNAYYNPMFNEIVFPAAILQPPFFDWEADASVNYGAIGAVIGHEITHGFDDQGSRFDKDGNLNEWWTPDDRERFDALTRQLIEQFDGYFPFEDLSLNGTFTLGENIADLGGLSVAYDALQLHHSRHGLPQPIDGFSSDQRFFMSWATVWRTKTRPEALRNQIKTDPHPPGMYRAVAAPSNLSSFYRAFDIGTGSKWYRSEKERIKIW